MEKYTETEEIVEGDYPLREKEKALRSFIDLIPEFEKKSIMYRYYFPEGIEQVRRAIRKDIFNRLEEKIAQPEQYKSPEEAEYAVKQLEEEYEKFKEFLEVIRFLSGYVRGPAQYEIKHLVSYIESFMKHMAKGIDFVRRRQSELIKK